MIAPRLAKRDPATVFGQDRVAQQATPWTYTSDIASQSVRSANYCPCRADGGYSRAGSPTRIRSDCEVSARASTRITRFCGLVEPCDGVMHRCVRADSLEVGEDAGPRCGLDASR